MSILINNIKEDQILSSFNFARNSDLVYSEMISKDNFKNINKNDLTIIYQTENMVFYKRQKFEIKENDVIFCNTHFITSLFEQLRTVMEIKNIKLITHQTDIPITKKIFNIKPECISEWYSININTTQRNLIPIPLGVSNDYSPKNPKYSEFNQIKKTEKKNRIYINFQINTNRLERFKLYNLFKHNDFFLIEEPNKSMTHYLQSLNENLFTLCPWGNGYDTHRFWESIYTGSIPITKRHETYNSASLLPNIQVDDYKQINFKKINNMYEAFSGNIYNYDKLSVDWWMSKIRENEIIDTTKSKIYINEEDKLHQKSLKELRLWTKTERRKKERKRYLFKVYKLIYIFCSKFSNLSGSK